jgi:hypothetical protein
MATSPDETVMTFLVGPWLAQAVRAAVDLSLAGHLADGPRTAATGGRIAPLTDIAMLASDGSRERTLTEFDDLLTRAAAIPVEPPYVVVEATVAA